MLVVLQGCNSLLGSVKFSTVDILTQLVLEVPQEKAIAHMSVFYQEISIFVRWATECQKHVDKWNILKPRTGFYKKLVSGNKIKIIYRFG